MEDADGGEVNEMHGDENEERRVSHKPKGYN